MDEMLLKTYLKANLWISSLMQLRRLVMVEEIDESIFSFHLFFHTVLVFDKQTSHWNIIIDRDNKRINLKKFIRSNVSLIWSGFAPIWIWSGYKTLTSVHKPNRLGTGTKKSWLDPSLKKNSFLGAHLHSISFRMTDNKILTLYNNLSNMNEKNTWCSRRHLQS